MLTFEFDMHGLENGKAPYWHRYRNLLPDPQDQIETKQFIFAPNTITISNFVDRFSKYLKKILMIY